MKTNYCISDINAENKLLLREKKIKLFIRFLKENKLLEIYKISFKMYRGMNPTYYLMNKILNPNCPLSSSFVFSSVSEKLSIDTLYFYRVEDNFINFLKNYKTLYVLSK